MARLRFYVGLFVVCFFIWFGFLHMIARADHNTFLPLVPNTPLMQSIIQTQTVKWCVNTTGQTYPNFITQIEDVQGEYTKRTGIKFQRVTWGPLSTTGCQVQHNLTDFSCNGCAAHIFYANWPVVIEYKVNLGYTDWRSAFGHELGHGLLGLHEQYKDSGGVIQCVYRDDTVMSCGSPYVKYPQPRDVNLGCSIILTTWCGAQTPPPITYPYWDGDEWVYEYWKFSPSLIDPFFGTPGTWRDYGDVSEWDPALADGKQYNRRLQTWFWQGVTKQQNTGGDTWRCVSFCFPGEGN